jgi:hypothetical protein
MCTDPKCVNPVASAVLLAFGVAALEPGFDPLANLEAIRHSLEARGLLERPPAPQEESASQNRFGRIDDHSDLSKEDE